MDESRYITQGMSSAADWRLLPLFCRHVSVTVSKDIIINDFLRQALILKRTWPWCHVPSGDSLACWSFGHANEKLSTQYMKGGQQPSESDFPLKVTCLKESCPSPIPFDAREISHHPNYFPLHQPVLLKGNAMPRSPP